jgi:hypothetical protein
LIFLASKKKPGKKFWGARKVLVYKKFWLPEKNLATKTFCLASPKILAWLFFEMPGLFVLPDFRFF